MAYQEIGPDELLSWEFGGQRMSETAWCVRWDEAGGRGAESVLGALPAAVDFSTSGSTGSPRVWRRTREQLWTEAGILAGLVRPGDPAAVVAFAPPVHIYGALASVLMPVQLGVPVWYRSAFTGALPDVAGRPVVVVATSWIFQLLLRHLRWVREIPHLTVLYSGATLPGTALELLDAAGRERVTLVELLGSTETGGVALRRWTSGEPPPWTLFPDVALAATPEPGEPVDLTVTSPRLAARPGGEPPPTWCTGDLIEPLDARTFRLLGRLSRLVKVNGRRFNLDELENRLRGVLACADFALVPVADRVVGEHVDLHIVLAPGTELSDAGLSAAYELMPVRPRRVSTVERIERSVTGKARQSATSS